MLYGEFKGPRAKIWGHTWLLPSLEPHILGLGLTMGLKHALQTNINKEEEFIYVCKNV
jgi:hypothetical protein